MPELAVMGREGDTKIVWDKDNPDEVENARRSFDDLVGKKKYAAFDVGKLGQKSNRLHSFNPDAEKMILVPPIRGG